MPDAALAGCPVLVTGGTGFLGSHLLAALRHAGAVVHGLSREVRPVTRIPVGGVRWHRGDVTDLASIAAAVAVARPAVVFHLAAWGTTADRYEDARCQDVNVQGSWHVWQALASTPARMVFTSTSGEYGPATACVRESDRCHPTSAYARSKHRAVRLLSGLARRDGRELVVLRPFGPYGPGDRRQRVIPQVIEGLLRGHDVAATDGTQIRDFGYVEDHVDALLRSASVPLEAGVAVFNVGGGSPGPLRVVLEAVATAVGPVGLQGRPVGRLRLGAVPMRKDEVPVTCADITAARAVLGYEPRVRLEEGLRRTVAWMRAELATVETGDPT